MSSWPREVYMSEAGVALSQSLYFLIAGGMFESYHGVMYCLLEVDCFHRRLSRFEAYDSLLCRD